MRDSTKYYGWSGFWLVIALFCFFYIYPVSAINSDFYWLAGSFIIGFYSLIIFNQMLQYAEHLRKHHESHQKNYSKERFSKMRL